MDIVSLLVRQALFPALAGIVVGLIGAFVLTRYLASLLYGVRATDAVIFAGVSLFLLGLSLAAALIPARRATRVDPTLAIRHE